MVDFRGNGILINQLVKFYYIHALIRMGC